MHPEQRTLCSSVGARRQRSARTKNLGERLFAYPVQNPDSLLLSPHVRKGGGGFCLSQLSKLDREQMCQLAPVEGHHSHPLIPITVFHLFLHEPTVGTLRMYVSSNAASSAVQSPAGSETFLPHWMRVPGTRREGSTESDGEVKRWQEVRDVGFSFTSY